MNFLRDVYSLLQDRRVWLGFASCMAAGIAIDRLYHAHSGFDNRRFKTPDRHRKDGNGGHAEVDFGGQWVMGRAILTGHGRELYDRNRLWQIVRAAYPRSAASDWVRAESFPKRPGVPIHTPEDPRHDDDWFLWWFMGQDSAQWSEVGRGVALPFAASDPFTATMLLAQSNQIVTPGVANAVNAKAVGGPLYPPVHGFFYAPLTVGNDPQTSYFVFQFLNLGFVVLAGWAFAYGSRGAIPWPAAVVVLLLYPGFRAGLHLGQNPSLTLAILACGWAFAARGRNVLGGAVWGLLAFKPVWGVAFFLVPLLQGRFRFCGAMIAAGLALVAATLPFVGLETWFDWLTVGKEATGLYQVNRNWIHLSRDLFGLPARLLIDFELPDEKRRGGYAGTVGWLLWGFVLATTTSVFLARRSREPAGAAVGFLALGAFLTCYRFMYYDAVLSAFGILLMFGEWRRWRSVWDYWPCLVLVALYVQENWLRQLDGTVKLCGITLGLNYDYAVDTLLILAIWAFAGVRLVLLPPQPVEGGADVRLAHQ